MSEAMEFDVSPLYPLPSGVEPPQDRQMLDLLQIGRNGVIGTVEAAIRFGELILELTYDCEEVERQKPLTALAVGEVWHITGSRNTERRVGEYGPFELQVWRYDARILKVGVPLIVPPFKPAENSGEK